MGPTTPDIPALLPLLGIFEYHWVAAALLADMDSVSWTAFCLVGRGRSCTVWHMALFGLRYSFVLQTGLEPTAGHRHPSLKSVSGKHLGGHPLLSLAHSALVAGVNTTLALTPHPLPCLATPLNPESLSLGAFRTW